MNIFKYSDFINESIEDNLYEVGDDVIYFDEDNSHYGYCKIIKKGLNGYTKKWDYKISIHGVEFWTSENKLRSRKSNIKSPFNKLEEPEEKIRWYKDGKLSESIILFNKEDDKLAEEIIIKLEDKKIIRIKNESTDIVNKIFCDIRGIRVFGPLKVIAKYILYENTIHKDNRYQTYLTEYPFDMEGDRLYCSVENSKKIWDLLKEKGIEKGSVSTVSDVDPFGEEDWED